MSCLLRSDTLFHSDHRSEAGFVARPEIARRRFRRRRSVLTAVAGAMVIAVASVVVSALPARAAAVINIVNRDGPAEGLNDPTVVAPVGGNSGTTRGAQRLQALQYAAGLWGARLTSAVATDIDATFDPMACGGSATWSSWWSANFANAIHTYTWYPVALANKLAGSDLCVAGPDCGNGSEFELFANSSLDDGSCPENCSWYYGLDGSPAPEQCDFVTIALIVIAKNLGMDSTIDLETGARWNEYYDVLSRQLVSVGYGKRLDELELDARRLAAVRDPGRLHWMGDESYISSWYLLPAAAGELVGGLGPWGTVEMYSPDPPIFGLSVSAFSPALEPDQLLEAPEESLRGVARHDFGLADDALADLGWAVCGNDVTEMDEECDEHGFCCAGGCCGCRIVADPVCGDGVLTIYCEERCDDGNVVAGDGCDAACQMEKPALDCQKAIYKAGRTYLRRAITALEHCRNAINRGKLDIAPADCASQGSVAPKLAAAATKGRIALSKKCTDTLVAALNACASTVDGLIAPAADAGCILDGCDQAVQREIAAAYGRVLDPSEKTPESCQRTIGKASTRYLLDHLDFRYECREKANESGYSVPCVPVIDVREGNLRDAYLRFREGIYKKGDCTSDVLTGLAACGGLPRFEFSQDGLTAVEAGCLTMVTSTVAEQLIQDWTGQ